MHKPDFHRKGASQMKSHYFIAQAGRFGSCHTCASCKNMSYWRPQCALWPCWHSPPLCWHETLQLAGHQQSTGGCSLLASCEKTAGPRGAHLTPDATSVGTASKHPTPNGSGEEDILTWPLSHAERLESWRAGWALHAENGQLKVGSPITPLTSAAPQLLWLTEGRFSPIFRRAEVNSEPWTGQDDSTTQPGPTAALTISGSIL